VDEFIGACQRWLVPPYAPWTPEQFDTSVFQAVAGLAQTRLTVLSEIIEYVDWLFLAQPPEDEVSWTKAMTPGAAGILASVRKEWANAEWTAEALRSGLDEAATEHGLKLGKAQAPVRVAVTGRTIGLPLFESVELLGRERTLARIDAAAARLRCSAPGLCPIASDERGCPDFNLSFFTGEELVKKRFRVK
jgi:glutamyl-tRNA synthetase